MKELCVNVLVHDSLCTSTKLCAFSSLESLYDVFRHTNASQTGTRPAAAAAVPLIPSVASPQAPRADRPPDVLANVHLLSVGGALSVMSSYAEYTEELSRAHICRFVCADARDHAELDSRWRDAVLLTGQEVLGPLGVPRAKQHGERSANRAVCSGVYVHRASHAQYHIGLITHASPHNSEVAELVEDLCSLLGVPEVDLPSRRVPIGEGLRACRLSLWWSPSGKRVVPYDTLPPIKVILHQREECLPPSEEGRVGHVFFEAYKEVRLFLHRPDTSHLLGNCTRSLPLAHPALSADGDHSHNNSLRTPPADAPNEELSDATDATVIYREDASDDRLNESSAPAHQRHPGAGTVATRASFMFTNVQVTHVGEHLLGAEVEVKDEYKPFAESLSQHLKPFLVVDRRECVPHY
ncbi:hypothetical protein AGDE_10141 [Angomonas deanei]|nr:hypothetical protein AGDE_10141 [Angomonas deanei]|eukprot:EPY29069.1 hypothetical protein AGDE_10141 [Angomonas deanei]